MANKYFQPIAKPYKVKAIPKLKPPRKVKARRTESIEWLSFAYRIYPGPDDADVKRIVNLFFKLRSTMYPAITLPEAVYYYMLDRDKIKFTYQAEWNGGRAQIGGAVPDFFLEEYKVVVLIHGWYWHSDPIQEERDLIEIQGMKNGYIDGARINAVVRISDVRIQSSQREDIYKLSLVGIEQYP